MNSGVLFHCCCLVRAYFSLLPLARNLVWLTAGPFGALFRRGRSSRFGQIWKRGPNCQGALRWRGRRMVRENSSPINGENQRFWKHLRKIFLSWRRSRCAFSQTPLTPTWEKSGKMTPPPENFFQHADRHRHFLPSLFNVQNRAFWKPFPKFFWICFVRVSTAIDHPCESCRHRLLSAAAYCPLTFYVKIEAKWHHLQKFFQHADHHRHFLPSLFNVQNRAFWKPLSINFFKLLRTSISSHRSPLRIMPPSPPVSGSILPATLLCKNRGKVETLFENFSEKQRSASSSEGAVFIRAALLSFTPPYLHGENQRFWKHLSKIFLQRRSSCWKLPYTL